MKSLRGSDSKLEERKLWTGRQARERDFKIILLRSVYFKITTIPCLSLVLILSNCRFMQNTFLIHKRRSSLLGKHSLRGRFEDISLVSAVLFGKSFGDITVCYFDLLITRTGIGELIPTISIS